MNNARDEAPPHAEGPQAFKEWLRQWSRRETTAQGVAATVHAVLCMGELHRWSHAELSQSLAGMLLVLSADQERMLVEQVMLRPPPPIHVHGQYAQGFTAGVEHVLKTMDENRKEISRVSISAGVLNDLETVLGRAVEWLRWKCWPQSYSGGTRPPHP